MRLRTARRGVGEGAPCVSVLLFRGGGGGGKICANFTGTVASCTFTSRFSRTWNDRFELSLSDISTSDYYKTPHVKLGSLGIYKTVVATKGIGCKSLRTQSSGPAGQAFNLQCVT